MSHGHDENDKVERLLQAARPGAPIGQLKARVTKAAREAWREGPADVPWRVPLRRLAVSAAAAALIVSLANLAADRSLMRGRAGGARVAQRETVDLEGVPEEVYGSVARRLLAANLRAPQAVGARLEEYREQMRQVLEEAQENGVANPPRAPNGRSRLLPVPSASEAYS
ncbi:MAG: hypothetical protein JW741_31290 [Sedimentisphaerales bacterium]|nr:hypothetical protein [Sedimentisphaerales bacterium]